MDLYTFRSVEKKQETPEIGITFQDFACVRVNMCECVNLSFHLISNSIIQIKANINVKMAFSAIM